MRLKIRITGAVQGVGFRPHVYRLATGRGLGGYVLNSVQGVVVEVEGAEGAVRAFEAELREGPPPNAVVREFTTEVVDPRGSCGFEVTESDSSGEPGAFLLPDLAVCAACLGDILDPANRRFGYPFTTCTHCGPRYSIVEGLPYDRPLTAMRGFPMCAECEAEYRDPGDRRFHAQTNCCRRCGPGLELWDARGEVLSSGDEALLEAARAVREGRIVALKGIGGFHLVCDGLNGEAVACLRARKRRPAKPFAVMAAGLEAARALCEVHEAAASLLCSPQSPIVLLERRADSPLPEGIAPGNPFVGLLVPYSPLHALLLDAIRGPIIATSGNLTDEPICIDEREALARLRGVADLFLVHNRPILRPVDDSIVRFMDGRAVLLRRARGYAPLPFQAARELPEMLATGAHMKNTVAFSRGSLIFLSQHLGDLSTLAAAESHARVIADLCRTYQLRPEAVACDLHPDYGSTRSALSLKLPVRTVQHHEAHVLAGVLEWGIAPPVLGVCWDGSGYGPDGTVWGGEFLSFDGAGFRRVAHLRTFPLPGGEQAVKEPRRSLLGVLHEMGRAELARHLFSAAEWAVLQLALARGLNCPRTSSAGRLFDAVAALVGLCPVASFEGEAAMLLEFAARKGSGSAVAAGTDWVSLMEALIESKLPVNDKAVLFHNGLVEIIARVAREAGMRQVLLTGGCFQNALLTELASARLREDGFTVFTHQTLPPNDGAIAAGQILGATLSQEREPCA